MFSRPQHRTVQAVLGWFRADALASCGFLFGGGTRIVLDLGEYRVSQDVDFLCSDPSGYGGLRLEAKAHGFAALFVPKGMERLRFPREMRLDQYGIRFPVLLEDHLLKVELIREARIELDPGVLPSWSPVQSLSVADCFAEKLLANSDRWADSQVLSRDLIDLAALRAGCGPIPDSAWSKVTAAYKTAAREDLRRALAAFQNDSQQQRRCWAGLSIENPAPILDGLALLAPEI